MTINYLPPSNNKWLEKFIPAEYRNKTVQRYERTNRKESADYHARFIDGSKVFLAEVKAGNVATVEPVSAPISDK